MPSVARVRRGPNAALSGGPFQAEPLNNQPFLRADRISTNLNVKANAVEELTYLCECIAAVDFLEDRSALEALAAFLRARLEASGKAAPMVLGTGVLDCRSFPGRWTSSSPATTRAARSARP